MNTNYKQDKEVAERVADYHLSCNRIADLFCETYDFYRLDEADSTFWVANEPGGILCTGDLTFSMEEMLTALQDGVDIKQLMRWVDYCSECFATEATPMNLKTYNKVHHADTGTGLA